MELQEKCLGIGVILVMAIIQLLLIEDTFQKAEVEPTRRATALGRVWDEKETEEDINIPIVFKVGVVEKKYKNPLKQAEYTYSLIESESSMNGSQ